jgi:hypothetical protein
LQAIHKRTTDSKIVFSRINNLKTLGSHKPINLNLIEAHNSHTGNELVDFLSKKWHSNDPHPPRPTPIIRDLGFEPFTSKRYKFLPYVKQHRSIIELYYTLPFSSRRGMKMMKNDKE